MWWFNPILLCPPEKRSEKNESTATTQLSEGEQMHRWPQAGHYLVYLIFATTLPGCYDARLTELVSSTAVEPEPHVLLLYPRASRKAHPWPLHTPLPRPQECVLCVKQKPNSATTSQLKNRQRPPTDISPKKMDTWPLTYENMPTIPNPYRNAKDTTKSCPCTLRIALMKQKPDKHTKNKCR